MYFVDSNYYTTTDLAEKLNVFSSYISGMIDQDDRETKFIVNQGQTIFVHKDWPKLKRFKEILNKDHNDYSKCISLGFLRTEFKFNPVYGKKYLGEVVEITNVLPKDKKEIFKEFFKFSDDVYNKIKDKTLFATDDPEEGIIRVSKNSYIGAY